MAKVARAREGIAYLGIEAEGYSGKLVADYVGVGLPSVYRAARRGRPARDNWDPLLRKDSK